MPVVGEQLGEWDAGLDFLVEQGDKNILRDQMSIDEKLSEFSRCRIHVWSLVLIKTVFDSSAAGGGTLTVSWWSVQASDGDSENLFDTRQTAPGFQQSVLAERAHPLRN